MQILRPEKSKTYMGSVAIKRTSSSFFFETNWRFFLKFATRTAARFAFRSTVTGTNLHVPLLWEPKKREPSPWGEVPNTKFPTFWKLGGNFFPTFFFLPEPGADCKMAKPRSCWAIINFSSDFRVVSTPLVTWTCAANTFPVKAPQKPHGACKKKKKHCQKKRSKRNLRIIGILGQTSRGNPNAVGEGRNSWKRPRRRGGRLRRKRALLERTPPTLNTKRSAVSKLALSQNPYPNCTVGPPDSFWNVPLSVAVEELVNSCSLQLKNWAIFFWVMPVLALSRLWL